MDWSTWKAATCLPDCWCEAARHGQCILEPVNTWTNLGFIFFGLFFLWKAKKLTISQNALSSDISFPRLYGVAMIFVGAGSFFYHASQTFVGQWFDVYGMYLVSIFYIGYNLFRTHRVNKTGFVLFYFIVTGLLGLIIIYWPESRRFLFGLSILVALIQCIWIQIKSHSKIKKRFLWGALGSYLLAQSLWILDKEKIWCNPYAWMNGHGLWHLLTAVSALLLYFYFQSEETL